MPTRPAAAFAAADDEFAADEEKEVTFGSCLAPLRGDVKADELAQIFEMSKLLGVQVRRNVKADELAQNSK